MLIYEFCLTQSTPIHYTLVRGKTRDIIQQLLSGSVEFLDPLSPRIIRTTLNQLKLRKDSLSV